MSAGVLVGELDHLGPRVVGVVPTLSHGRRDDAPLDLAKWGWVHSAIERYYAGNRAIGWYLSRPGMRAHLDEAALGLHRSYFPNGPAVLLLVDQTSGRAALHAGTDGVLQFIQELETDMASAHRSSAPSHAASWLSVLAALGVVAGVGLWWWAGMPGGTP